MNAYRQSIKRFKADVTSHRATSKRRWRWARSGCGHGSIFRKRVLYEPASPSRHAEWLRAGLDTRRDGRNRGVRRGPVYAGIYQFVVVAIFCRVGPYRARYDFADATGAFSRQLRN